MKKEIINVVPLSQIGKISLGMSRSEVRSAMGSDFVEFKKSKFSKNTSDDYHFLHVFYNVANECVAVEIFDDCQISINGTVLPCEKNAFIQWLKTQDSNAEISGDGAISKKLSIGMTAAETSVESVLFGKPGYYE